MIKKREIPDGMGSPLTLQHIASALGISKSTVQRALTACGRCSPSTREKVLAMVKQLGYRPDPIFSAIGSRRRRQTLDSVPIAYVDSVPKGGPTPGWGYLPEVTTRASELGYRIEYVNLTDFEPLNRIWTTLYARGFAGVILGSVKNIDLPVLMKGDVFPMVCCGRIDSLPYHTVRSSAGFAMHFLWEKLLALGYRRIGAATGFHHVEVEDDFSRFAAAMGCLTKFHSRKEFIPPFQGYVDDHDAFCIWFRKYAPEVVIGLNSGSYRWLRGLGCRVPEEVGFAVLNQPKDGECVPPFFSGINQNSAHVGFSAMNLLDQMIRHGERGIPEIQNIIVVSPHWVEGKTCRQPI